MSQAGDHAKTMSLTLDDFSQQLHTMADTSDQPDARVAEFARSAADTLGRGAQRLNDGGIDGLLDDVKRLARNRPAVFLLGSIAAGFAVGRLVKHSDVRGAVEQAKSEITSDSTNDSDDRAVGSPRPAALAPPAIDALGAAEGSASGPVNDPGLPDVGALGSARR